MSRFVVPTPRTAVSRGPVPTFSILIPTYESTATLPDAVASAITQTSPALEVIVCDDGSTDDVAEALSGYRDQVRLLRKPNGGAASALNHAACAALGDFVAILDADDVYDPRRLEALGRLAVERPDLDIITTDAHLEVEGVRGGRFNDSTPFVVDDQRDGILRSCFVGGWPAVRRGRVLGLGGWDESRKIAYDWDCWLRLIFDGAEAGLVDEPLMSYRIHEGSLSSNRLASLAERVAILEQARTQPSLTRRQRRLVCASIRWQRSRLLLEAEEQAAAAGAADPIRLRATRARELLAHARLDSPLAAWRSRPRHRRANAVKDPP
jgi:glycosyltransferase involved in cell wall biosynthesis